MQGPDESIPPSESPTPSLAIETLPDWIPQPIEKILSPILDNSWLAFVVIVVVAYLVGKLVQLIVANSVAKLAAKTRTDLDDQLIALTRKPIFLTVFLFGLSLATYQLGLSDTLTEILVNVLRTILVLAWLGASWPFCRLLLQALGRHRERFPLIEERTIPLFDIVTKLLLFGGTSYAVLVIWDIDATAWLTSAGVIGIAVGFAAKDTLANLFAGFFIVADAPYKIGDFVVLDSGERGQVTHVGIRSTRLETRDDIQITLPNASIANSKIINETGGKWERERIRIKVGVAYGSDVDQVCQILEAIAVRHEHICTDPAPRVRMRGFGDSSLDFELLCWIDEPVLRGVLSHDLYMDVYKTFGKEEIEIPFPKRDVYLYDMGSKS